MTGSASIDGVGHRGLPLLGTVAETAEVCAREKVDTIYVALPIEEHVKMLGVVEFASRECIDVHVVPDLLQFIALRARLEDLDGLPIISINDVPLRGLNSVVKRVVDVVLSLGALLLGAVPALIVVVAHQADVARARFLPAGAHGTGWQAVHGLQVSIHAGRRRGRDAARSGRPTTIRA